MKKPTKHIVAFIDVLGFKDLIDGYFSGKLAKNFIEIFDDSIEGVNRFLSGINLSSTNYYGTNFKIKKKHFSDCICISAELSKKIPDYVIVGYFLTFIKLYQIFLMRDKIYIRGGISIGEHFENKNMIFSEALVNAYILEKDKAIYPRIIIDKSVLSIIDKAKAENSIEFRNSFFFYKHTILKDSENAVFISPFDFTGKLDINILRILKKRIENQISNVENTSQDEIDANYIDMFSLLNNQILKDVEDKINSFPIDNDNVRKKYIWLKDLFLWSKDSLNSDINFIKVYE